MIFIVQADAAGGVLIRLHRGNRRFRLGETMTNGYQSVSTSGDRCPMQIQSLPWIPPDRVFLQIFH